MDSTLQGSDMYIKVKLEQDVKTVEFLTMKLDTKDAYQNFNANYGVLIGRVVANGGVGIPNTKISIFIPLSNVDAEDGEITSIYPYTTPRDKNNEGKRYNLLPRVSQYDPKVGTYKPAQPFGSFLIKPELVTNQPFLNVYKKYYKYTALTNDNGDYMIFGVPTGNQTVHMSVDITDIGKYSMSPQTMIVSGYPANLFTKNGSRIKASEDLNDLPNIETQEIDVNIIPFWGDTENFEIGITRQDFRIRAVVGSSFTIFGTSMTMGQYAFYGNATYSNENGGLYAMSNTYPSPLVPSIRSNIDVRVNRIAPIDIRVFSFEPNSKNIEFDGDGVTFLSGFNPDIDIIELSDSDYYKFTDDYGNFVLNIPCNQIKIITNDLGIETQVSNNSSIGVYSKFYGMILAKYPDVDTFQIVSVGNGEFKRNRPPHPVRGWFKIPQSIGLIADGMTTDGKINGLDWELNNNNWRKEYFPFKAGEIYSIAQFFPTKNPLTYNDNVANVKSENTFGNTMNVDGDTYVVDIRSQGGAWFKVSGVDNVDNDASYPNYDNSNYIKKPVTGSTPEYIYDFPYNVTKFSNQPSGETYFGGQWLNFSLFFPQYAFVFDSVANRNFNMADVYHNNYDTEYFISDNTQKIFAGLSNTKFLLKGDAFRTNFIRVPREELEKLKLIPAKGINVRKWNTGQDSRYNGIQLSADTYKYDPIKPLIVITDGRTYDSGFGWDANAPYAGAPSTNPTAYLFRGMYDNDCVKLVFDLGLI
jgi:hypothetical protein